METLIRIGKLKAGDCFEMDGRHYIITRGGHGYPDVEFKVKAGGKDTLTTSNKNLFVKLISLKQ